MNIILGVAFLFISAALLACDTFLEVPCWEAMAFAAPVVLSVWWVFK